MDGHLYLLEVYVDDCILLGKQGPFIDRFKAAFGKRFKIEDLGPVSWLLGCEITRDRKNRILRIGQRQFCIDMLVTFGMLDCSPVGTPLSARTPDGPPIKSPPLNTKKFDYPALMYGWVSFKFPTIDTYRYLGCPLSVVTDTSESTIGYRRQYIGGM